MKRTDPVIRRVNLKLVGWWSAAVSAVLLALFFILRLHSGAPTDPIEMEYVRRAIETLSPLMFAIQAAFIFSPDNEPAFELLLALPVTLPRLFRDRLFLVAGMHLAVALTATLAFAAAWGAENPALALVRWLAAGLVLGGVAIFTTQITRQGVFGTLMATLLWAASLYGGDAILKRWPWFWPFHVYLQPEKLGLGHYILNRFGLVAVGLGLFLLSMKFVSDGDRLLGNR